MIENNIVCVLIIDQKSLDRHLTVFLFCIIIFYGYYRINKIYYVNLIKYKHNDIGT